MGLFVLYNRPASLNLLQFIALPLHYQQMAGNDISELLVIAQDAVSGLDDSRWPIEDLDELAYQVIPEGHAVNALSAERYEVDVVQDELAGSVYSIEYASGSLATTGFFGGFQVVKRKETFDDIEMVDDVLAVRLNTLGSTAYLIPVNGLANLEPETTNAIEVLGDDEVLADIDELIMNDAVDFDSLWDLFVGMDIEDMRTSLYVDYLNTVLPLADVGSGFITDTLLYLSEVPTAPHDKDQDVLVLVEPGKSFCLISVTFENGTESNMLCINALVGEDGDSVKVPLNRIKGIIGHA